MKGFNYINTEYVPTVDLNTLGNTFNTLEQGHKEAIKTASNLQAEMAKLELNEAENEWRQQKISEIQQTIDNNTIFGNSAAALDDIIVKAGNLASDAGMIGRLQAQKDYTEFKNKIINDKTLPEDYKEYYLENNPYYYKDIVDEKTGKVISGTKWNPNISPTAVVDLSSLISKGLQWAARESGTYNQVRWLDKNGNPTTNPNEVFDGEYYDDTTHSFEKLDRSKIEAGIRAAIESTPGAKESLQQDYDIALWKHKKAINATKGKYNIVSDVTDDNGITLSPQQYLNKRISPALYAAEYYNTTRKTTYGNGLKTYKAAKQAAETAKKNAELDDEYIKSLNRTSDTKPITINYNMTAELMGEKQNIQNELYNLFKNAVGRDVNIDMTNASTDGWKNTLTRAYLTIKKNGATEQQLRDFKVKTNELIRKYDEITMNYDNLTKDLKEDDKYLVDYVSRMKNGGSFNKDNPYDQKLLKDIQAEFGDKGQYYDVSFNNIDEYNRAIQILNSNNENGFLGLGFNTGRKEIDGKSVNYIRLPKEYYQNMLLLSNTVNAAVKGNIDNITVQVLDSEYNPIIPKSQQDNSYVTSPYNSTSQIYDFESNYSHKYLYNVYRKAADKKFLNYSNDFIKQQDKLNTVIDNYQEITIGHQSLPGETNYQQLLLHQLNTNQIDNTEYNLRLKIDKEELRRKIMSHGFGNTKMFTVEDDGGYGTFKEVTNTKNREDEGNKIISAVGNGKAVFNSAHNPFFGSGTNITIYPKLDSNGNPTGIPKTYFIPGLVNDEAQEAFENNPYTKASDHVAKMDVYRMTTNLSESGDTPTLGAQRLIANGGNLFTYKNGNIEVNIDRKAAVDIYDAMNEYIDIQNNFTQGNLQLYNENAVERLNGRIFEIAKTITNSIGRPDLLERYYSVLSKDLGSKLNI
jgi:hypothetical protein